MCAKRLRELATLIGPAPTITKEVNVFFDDYVGLSRGMGHAGLSPRFDTE